jgi:pimeloyl-ACP methyl ester carboxylesterase
MSTRFFFLSLLAVALSFNSFSQTNQKQNNMTKRNTKTVLFITGAYVSNSCWDQWKAYFESKGYTCIAPAWPYKDAPPMLLRSRQPNADIASIRLTQLVDYYADIINTLPEKPIVIGHSIGGLVTQLLMQRNLVAYGAVIHSVPTKGVNTFKWSALKAGWRGLGYFTSTRKAYLMSFKTWQYAFTNGMPLNDQQAAYDQYVIPESKLVCRDWMTKLAKVDYKKPHAPLLFISGSTDNIVPASFNYDNYRKYQDSNSVTDYKEFEGRNHYVLGQPTWKEDADYILDWVGKHMNAYVTAKGVLEFSE